MRRAVPHTVRTHDELAEVAAHYAKADWFVFDVETGLNKYRGHPVRNRVVWLGIGDDERTDLIPMGHPKGELIAPEYSERVPWFDEDDLTKRGKPRKKWRTVRHPARFTPAPTQLWPAEVYEALEPAFFGGATKIGHGVKFDLESIAKHYGGQPPAPPYGDTLIQSFLLNSNLKYGLKSITNRLYEHDYDAEDVAKPKADGTGGIDIHPFSKVARYLALDLAYTRYIHRSFTEAIERSGMKNLYRLEMDVLEVLLDMELTGIRVDRKAMMELGRGLSRDIVEIEKRIFAVSGEVWDLTSTPQKQRFVYEIRGHEPFAWTKGGKDGSNKKPSTAKGVLEVYAASDPVVADLLDYAAVQKLRSTYTGVVEGEDDVEGSGGLLDHIVDGRIHTDLVSYGAATGRFSSRRPNLQNIPVRAEDERAKAIRRMFIADPGMSLIVADYSQIEYRVLAHFSGDPTLIRAFEEGWDPHAATMAMLLDKPIEDVTPHERDQGKVSNFADIYGAGPGTVAASAGVTIERAKWIRDERKKRFPQVDAWKKECVRTARSRRPHPYVTTLLGRRRYLPALWSDNQDHRLAAERQAVNTQIQGTAADIIKVAMVRLHRALPDEAKMLLQVHDELIVTAPDEMAEEVRDITKKTMESVDYLKVPLVAEANIGKNWAEAK